MFFRSLVYSIKRLLRKKEVVFWNLCFPIILGTLFSVTFGSNMEKSELFHTVQAAYVESENADENFSQVLEELQKGATPLLEVKRTDMEEGERLLEKGEISGILKNEEGEITLFVKEEGISQSILKLVTERYRQRRQLFTDIAQTHPERLSAVMNSMQEEVSVLREEHYTEGSMDIMNEYFYALIAMSCLYGCFGGVTCGVENKADVSALAARRAVASTNRFVSLCADLAAAILNVCVCTLIGVFYLKYAMGANFGSNMLPMLLVILVGAFIGVATGFFIGSIGKMREDSKIGMAVSVTMAECFLSGLMVGNMYHVIQAICPVLNKINPAALIVDALYSLDIYSDYRRFGENLCILGIMAAALCAVGYLRVRRERYASI